MKDYVLEGLINVRGPQRVFKALLRLARDAGHLDLVSSFSGKAATLASIYSLFNSLLSRPPYFGSRFRLVNDIKRSLARAKNSFLLFPRPEFRRKLEDFP